MKEEDIFKTIFYELLKKDEVDLFKVLNFGLLSLSRQFSIYLFNIGRNIGKFFSIEKTRDVDEAMKELDNVMKKLGISCKMSSSDKKFILEIERSPSKISNVGTEHLFLERGIIQGFLEESLEDLNIFTKEEGNKIIIEIYGEEELIRKILGK